MLFFMLAFACSGSAQNSPSSIRLEYVGDTFHIQVDGGEFYTYDTTDFHSNMSNNKYILVMSGPPREAFIKVAGRRDFVYLHPITAEKWFIPSTIDTTTFIGDGYMIKFNTRKVKELNHSYNLFKGSLTIKHNNKQEIIKVQGAVLKL